MLPLTKIEQLFKTEFKIDNIDICLDDTTLYTFYSNSDDDFPFCMHINQITDSVKIYYRDFEIFNHRFTSIFYDETNVLKIIKSIKEVLNMFIKNNIPTNNITDINIIITTTGEVNIIFKIDDSYCNVYGIL